MQWLSVFDVQVHGVIFVVDAANADRFDEAKESLEQVNLTSQPLNPSSVSVYLGTPI